MSFSIDDCEPFQAYRSEVRKARKDHNCSACRRTILKDTYYMYVSYIFDGEAADLKRCGSCEALYEHLVKMGDGETCPAQLLDCGESYQDHWDEDPPEEIVALAFLSDDQAGQLLEKQRVKRLQVMKEVRERRRAAEASQ